MRERASLVEDTIGVGGTRSNRKNVSMKSLRVIVDIVQLRAGGVPSSDHCAHAQAIPTVGVPIACAIKGGGGGRHRGYSYIVFARSFEAAATEILSLFRSS